MKTMKILLLTASLAMTQAFASGGAAPYPNDAFQIDLNDKLSLQIGAH